MGNETRDQLKSLVVINAAIAEADEEIQMIETEINTHGYDKKYVSVLKDLNHKVSYYRYQKIKSCVNLYDKIEALSDEQEKRLIKYRYMRGYHWEAIAEKMGYSDRQIYNIHTRALQKINKSS
jgi:DNA-directed RNA polymerase specialized sigma subunit